MEQKLKKGDRIRRKSDGEIGTITETGWDNVERSQIYVIVEWITVEVLLVLLSLKTFVVHVFANVINRKQTELLEKVFQCGRECGLLALQATG